MAKGLSSVKNSKPPATIEMDSEEKEYGTPSEEKEKRVGAPVNPLMQRLAPEMLSAPYPIEMRSGKTMNSFDFALAKLDQMIVAPLGLDGEEEWLTFARHLFAYRQRVEEQRVEEQANKLLDDLRQNPAMLQRLVQRLNAELIATKTSASHKIPHSFLGEPSTGTPLDVLKYS